MIQFKTWLLQIIGYCDFIVDKPSISSAWIDRDFSKTSVTDFDELYEQIFDDLDSDTFDAELDIHLSTNVAARQSLSAFLDAIRRVDQLREQCVDLQDSRRLLQSQEWRDVENAAKQVILLLRQIGQA